MLGQALYAAGQTVDERYPHSLHAYFLRRGDVEAPIVYEVDRARDGASFSNRRIVAIQHGRPIFNMAASFQKEESGIEHQADMPDVAGPDGLADRSEVGEVVLAQVHEKMRRYLTRKRPFMVRPRQVYENKYRLYRTLDKVYQFGCKADVTCRRQAY